MQFFLLFSVYLSAQEKLKVFNETEVYDKKGKLFKFYKYETTLDLEKKYEDFAVVKIDSDYYIVESKFYIKKPKKVIVLGMTNYDVVNELGQPDNISTSQSTYGVTRIYVYGSAYYHFDDDKLTAINTY